MHYFFTISFILLKTYLPNSDVSTPNIRIVAPNSSSGDNISLKNIAAKIDANIGSKLKISAAFTGVVYLWYVVWMIVSTKLAKIALNDNDISKSVVNFTSSVGISINRNPIIGKGNANRN